jgi:hypothetical protein
MKGLGPLVIALIVGALVFIAVILISVGVFGAFSNAWETFKSAISEGFEAVFPGLKEQIFGTKEIEAIFNPEDYKIKSAWFMANDGSVLGKVSATEKSAVEKIKADLKKDGKYKLVLEIENIAGEKARVESDEFDLEGGKELDLYLIYKNQKFLATQTSKKILVGGILKDVTGPRVSLWRHTKPTAGPNYIIIEKIQECYDQDKNLESKEVSFKVSCDWTQNGECAVRYLKFLVCLSFEPPTLGKSSSDLFTGSISLEKDRYTIKEEDLRILGIYECGDIVGSLSLEKNLEGNEFSLKNGENAFNAKIDIKVNTKHPLGSDAKFRRHYCRFSIEYLPFCPFSHYFDVLTEKCVAFSG